MKGPPVLLNRAQADAFLSEARRTAVFRNSQLMAAAVMPNHVHMVVVAPAELSGERLLQEFKRNGARVLHQKFGKVAPGTIWTKSGSTR
jgi:REP element-mobilizing transposase RayT